MKARDWLNANYDRSGGLCLVLEATSATGLAYARELAGMGCSLVLAAQQAGGLAEAARALEQEFGVQAVALLQDTSSAERFSGFLEVLRSLPIGLVVNNGWFAMKEALPGFSKVQYEQAVDRHLLYPLAALRQFLLAREAGTPALVINAVSVYAAEPAPFAAAYTATNSYLFELLRDLEDEFPGRDPALTWHTCLPETAWSPFGSGWARPLTAPDRDAREEAAAVARASLADVSRRCFVPAAPGAQGTGAEAADFTISGGRALSR